MQYDIGTLQKFLTVFVTGFLLLPFFHFNTTTFLSAIEKRDASLKNIIVIYHCNSMLSLPIMFFFYFTNFKNAISDVAFIISMLITGNLLLFHRILSKTQQEPHKERIVSFVYSFIMTAYVIMYILVSFSFFNPEIINISRTQSGPYLMPLFYIIYLIFITLLGEMILIYGKHFLTSSGSA